MRKSVGVSETIKGGFKFLKYTAASAGALFLVLDSEPVSANETSFFDKALSGTHELLKNNTGSNMLALGAIGKIQKELEKEGIDIDFNLVIINFKKFKYHDVRGTFYKEIFYDNNEQLLTSIGFTKQTFDKTLDIASKHMPERFKIDGSGVVKLFFKDNIEIIGPAVISIGLLILLCISNPSFGGIHNMIAASKVRGGDDGVGKSAARGTTIAGFTSSDGPKGEGGSGDSGISDLLN